MKKKEAKELSGVLKEFLSFIGSKGGSVKGESKRRGDSDYYKKLSEKRKNGRPAKKTDRKSIAKKRNTRG